MDQSLENSGSYNSHFVKSLRTYVKTYQTPENKLVSPYPEPFKTNRRNMEKVQKYTQEYLTEMEVIKNIVDSSPSMQAEIALNNVTHTIADTYNSIALPEVDPAPFMLQSQLTSMGGTCVDVGNDLSLRGSYLIKSKAKKSPEVGNENSDRRSSNTYMSVSGTSYYQKSHSIIDALRTETPRRHKKNKKADEILPINHPDPRQRAQFISREFPSMVYLRSSFDDLKSSGLNNQYLQLTDVIRQCNAYLLTNEFYEMVQTLSHAQFDQQYCLIKFAELYEESWLFRFRMHVECLLSGDIVGVKQEYKNLEHHKRVGCYFQKQLGSENAYVQFAATYLLMRILGYGLDEDWCMSFPIIFQPD